jgi:hypothetical protein
MSVDSRETHAFMRSSGKTVCVCVPTDSVLTAARQLDARASPSAACVAFLVAGVCLLLRGVCPLSTCTTAAHDHCPNRRRWCVLCRRSEGLADAWCGVTRPDGLGSSTCACACACTRPPHDTHAHTQHSGHCDASERLELGLRTRPRSVLACACACACAALLLPQNTCMRTSTTGAPPLPPQTPCRAVTQP